ncbi:MAG: M13 family metallopeptidase N-terminal domain-containing protein [Ferruginibacter sp.]
MLELVNNLQTAFENRITKLDWMSDSTKQKAIEKLHAFTKKIAFPDNGEITVLLLFSATIILKTFCLAAKMNTTIKLVNRGNC